MRSQKGQNKKSQKPQKAQKAYKARPQGLGKLLPCGRFVSFGIWSQVDCYASLVAILPSFFVFCLFAVKLYYERKNAK